MAKLVIHAGTGKTGTSSIQVSLLKNKDALSSQGIVFLESNLSKPGKSAKHGLDWENPRSRDWKELRDEARRLAKTDQTVVISNEALWKKGPRQLRILKKAFKGFEFQVVIYVREQVEFLESRTLQSLKKGRKVLDLDFSDLRNPAGLDPFLGQFIPHLDYLKTAKRLGRVFGRHSVRARLYSRDVFTDGNVVADFFEVIGAETQALDLSTETNPSLSVPFAIITTSHGDYLPTVESRSEILDAGLRLSRKVKTNVPRLISAGKAQEIRDRFSKSNDMFFRKYVENADAFTMKPWTSGEPRELQEFADEMKGLIEKWPLVHFNGFGPKKANLAVFCNGWETTQDAGGFRARQVGDESRLRFRIHLRARSRSENSDLKLWLKCVEPNALVKVNVGDADMGEIDLAGSPIPIPASGLGEFDNVEITLVKTGDTSNELSITGLCLDEETVSGEASSQQG